MRKDTRKKLEEILAKAIPGDAAREEVIAQLATILREEFEKGFRRGQTSD